MLNSAKKINILTLVLSEKIFLNKTKNHNPCKLNGRSLNYIILELSSKHCLRRPQRGDFTIHPRLMLMLLINKNAKMFLNLFLQNQLMD